MNTSVGILSVMALLSLPPHGTAEIIQIGAGSYTTTPPPNASGPPAKIQCTAKVTGKMPSNGWWTSLAWGTNYFAHYPHPLAVMGHRAGLRIFYPAITANRIGVFGGMAGGFNDFVLGHSAVEEFPPALVDGFSDWIVRVLFATNDHRLRLSYGHGSPFVDAVYDGGEPRLIFASAPAVWSGSRENAVLGVTVRNRHYGLFGPSGSRWSGLGSSALTNHSNGKRYFSVAVLPDNQPATLALFAQHAYAHVTNTTVAWRYDAASSTVTTTYQFETTAYEGTELRPLFALYPSQWRNSTNALLGGVYDSVRGPMKLGQGLQFVTQMQFPGVLPALPNVGGCDTNVLATLLRDDLSDKNAPHDTYWEGKWLGRRASLVPIAEQYGRTDDANTVRQNVTHWLTNWFTATANGAPKAKGLFYYDQNWGTLIGYPASYGSDRELNDHHFHYGYFIKAAAELARHDPAWGSERNWGGLVKLLIRDIASADRRDPLFPFLRNFDPYAGHSWACGHARFADGNNQESSSEAMNAWAGLILWGEATGDTATRDLGIYLFTTELNAINEYWFDVHGENHPVAFTASVATMIWGGKSVNETWFTAKPECVHGINWLPFHGGSLYLGGYPDYVEKNYQALVTENRGTNWTAWADLVLMYRALSNPSDAMAQYEAAGKNLKAEGGNAPANTYHWIYSLNALGRVERAVVADYPLSAVFRQGSVRTYCCYNMQNAPRTVTFSDGFKLTAAGKGFVVGKHGVP